MEDDGSPLNVFENIATYFSLLIFGNNYYGLRMASVIAALLIFILLFFVLKRILNLRINRNMIIFIALLYLLFDFSFLLAGRIAEPTIFRILALCFILYLGTLLPASKPLINQYISLAMGFLSMFAVLYVYIYNLFILAAIMMTVLILSAKAGQKNIVKQILAFFIGATICLLSYLLFVYIVYGQNINDIYNLLIPYKDRLGIETSIIANWRHYAVNFVAVFTTNFLRFNVAILFIFLISLPAFIHKIFKEKNNFDILVFNLLLFLILQSIIVNDFNFRKMLILQPLVLLIIVIAFTYLSHFSKIINNKKRLRMIKIYWLFAYFITFFIHLGSIFPKMLNPFIIINTQAIMPGRISQINLAVFLLVFILITMYFLSKHAGKQKIIIAAILLLFIPNFYLDYKYIYSNQSYLFRDSMIEIGEIVDGKVLAGGWSYGFRLYNDSIPVLNPYKYVEDPERVKDYFNYFQKIFNNNDADYVISYNFNQNSVKNYKKQGFKIIKSVNYINVYEYED